MELVWVVRHENLDENMLQILGVFNDLEDAVDHVKNHLHKSSVDSRGYIDWVERTGYRTRGRPRPGERGLTKYMTEQAENINRDLDAFGEDTMNITRDSLARKRGYTPDYVSVEETFRWGPNKYVFTLAPVF